MITSVDNGYTESLHIGHIAFDPTFILTSLETLLIQEGWLQKPFAQALIKHEFPKTNKRCPNCSTEMAPRKNKANREYFLGCMNYPNCQGTRSLYEFASKVVDR